MNNDPSYNGGCPKCPFYSVRRHNTSETLKNAKPRIFPVRTVRTDLTTVRTKSQNRPDQNQNGPDQKFSNFRIAPKTCRQLSALFVRTARDPVRTKTSEISLLVFRTGFIPTILPLENCSSTFPPNVNGDHPSPSFINTTSTQSPTQAERHTEAEQDFSFSTVTTFVNMSAGLSLV
jgi:hypothetical protein